MGKLDRAGTIISDRTLARAQGAEFGGDDGSSARPASQTDFFRPKLLGSSIIEGENVGTPLTQASCISCHALSSVRSDGFEGINLLTANPVGFPQPLPSKAWIRRDFVWSLGLACPNGPHNPMQAGSLQQDCASALP
jgi:hypothetical protein